MHKEDPNCRLWIATCQLPMSLAIGNPLFPLYLDSFPTPLSFSVPILAVMMRANDLTSSRRQWSDSSVANSAMTITFSQISVSLSSFCTIRSLCKKSLSLSAPLASA
ncbi:MAG: hypothetical protein H6Q30_1849 [Bacteroidetes bacterium]|nr:hypothetical protein [Bacteroidota bacterium]